MAELGAYYGLCPLIDHRSLLGISPDAQNGNVIVTLGRNIAIKFKLSDQKQLSSWRTKDKFSSPIIYDKTESQYLAAFNDTFLRKWSIDEEESLDKLKKIKFNQNIHTLFLCLDRSFIVFKNGAVNPLKEAIENRKEPNWEGVITSENDYIVDVLYTSFNEYIYVGLIIKSNENCSLYWTQFNESSRQEKFGKIPLQRETFDLTGYVFLVDKSSVNFLSLWSDSRVYSTTLQEEAIDFGELFTVIESIACKEYVSMISLDHNYIALYGCNSNEEGALLVVYNIQFKVVQTRQSFKLFTNGAKLHSINGNLFFPVGQNLAVVPYHLDMEQLAALVGSHNAIGTNPDPDVAVVHRVQFANWGNLSESSIDEVPNLIEPRVADLMSQGLSTHLIFQTLFAEILEQNDTEVLGQLLLYFKDIPESCMVQVIKAILSMKSDVFKKDSQCALENFPEEMQPIERAELLDIIFTKPFSETLIVPHLRSLLSTDDVLILLQYIYFLLSDDGHSFPSHSFVGTEEKLIEWSCILVDSNYQKFLLSKDDKVIEILVILKNRIKEELDSLEDLQKVASFLRAAKRGNAVSRPFVGSSDYSIEDFSLY